MKEVLWFYNNPDGTRGFVRNPFAPGADTQKQDELRKFSPTQKRSKTFS